MYKNPTTQKLVSALYSLEGGDPVELVGGQLEIFDIIAGRLYPRVHMMTPTQYGKSFTVALAVLTRVTHYPEKWTIIAPKKDQAGIIMGYIIDHTFDNDMIAKKFEIDPRESRDAIRRERSRNRMTYKLADGSIGGVQVLSAQGSSKKNVLDSVMGFGSPNIILDESSLLGDDHFAGIIRMLGGYQDNMLVQIGNPFYRNHFYRDSKNPRYKKIHIDYRQAIEEGRMTEDYIEEMREAMRPELFRVMYEVRFPEADAIDQDGYSPLLTDEDLDRAERDDVQLVGTLRLGVDVAAGGMNKTVVTLRGSNAAKMLLRTSEADPAVLGAKIVMMVNKYKLGKRSVFVDRNGVGHGLWKWLENELGADVVVGVSPGSKADDTSDLEGLEFLNLRSVMNWRAAEWIQKGGKLKRHRGWREVEDIRYRVVSDKKIKIKSKDELSKEGIASPDVWDSLTMTFAELPRVESKSYKQKERPTLPYQGGSRDEPMESVGASSAQSRGFDRYTHGGY